MLSILAPNVQEVVQEVVGIGGGMGLELGTGPCMGNIEGVPFDWSCTISN